MLTNTWKHFVLMLLLGILAWAFAVGGGASYGVGGGAFCVYSNYGSGNAYAYFGSRLCKKS